MHFERVPEDVEWPAEMELTITEFPRPLMELLYVKHAWELSPWIQIPELEPAPPVGTSQRPAHWDLAALELRWAEVWRANVYWNARSQGDYSDKTDLAQHFGITGPVWWSREHGWDGLDQAAFSEWMATLDGLKTATVFDSPERRALPDAVAAWRHGLRQIFVMPYKPSGGAEWNGPEFMTVAAGTRRDPDAYPSALRTGLSMS